MEGPKIKHAFGGQEGKAGEVIGVRGGEMLREARERMQVAVGRQACPKEVRDQLEFGTEW